MTVTDPPERTTRDIEPGTWESRLRRLATELEDEGVPVLQKVPDEQATLEELAYAIRPRVHERRVPTYGAVVVPGGTARTWAEATAIPVQLVPVADRDPELFRLLADGMTTFVLRCPQGITHLVCFDRVLTDEYALATLQEVAGGVLVQRHPTGQVRVFGPSGLVRWDGISWYHEPPVALWIDALSRDGLGLDAATLADVLRFAVFELSARHIGATLVVRRPDPPPPEGSWDERLPSPPRLSIRARGEAAAIRHVLAQTDGAAVLGPDGVLQAIGVRLVPSILAEADVAGMGGTRHTAAVRYSHDDPDALVVVVSEDGPVTVLRGGRSVATAAEQVCRVSRPG